MAEASIPGAVREDAPAGVTLRVMTYNIEFGRRWGQVRDLIRAHPVDILCLQEVPEAAHPDPGAIRPDQIVRDFDWPHDCAMLWRRAPRRVGNMTLIRGRIGPGRILETPLSAPYGLVNEVEVRGARLTVANIHMTEMLGPPPLTFAVSEMFRLREALDLTRRCRGARRPVIAVGDFNTFSFAPGCWVMRRHWTDCRSAAGGNGRHLSTRPTYGLPFVIDHVFLRGGISVVDYQVLPGGGSDHRAVTATVRIPVERGR